MSTSSPPSPAPWPRTLPRIAITLGDPEGIGPEIVCKLLADKSLQSSCRLVAFAHKSTLAAANSLLGLPDLADPGSTTAAIISRGHWLSDSPLPTRPIIIIDDERFVPSPPGHLRAPSRQGGLASFAFVSDAIDAALLPRTHSRHVSAIVTAPISKTSWSLAGHTQFPGHTELLAARCNAPNVGMLFVGPSLRVILATIHIPLAQVASHLTTEGILDSITLAHRACIELGIPHPRIAVAGLNPHAGESNILGTEDSSIIAPAIALARAQSINALGPFPGDTIFNSAAKPPHGKGLFDCVVAMYHDQGLIPAKLLDGYNAINVTTGLPIIRTSPAHGTAFDIAWQNHADPTSLLAATKLAIDMTNHSAT